SSNCAPKSASCVSCRRCSDLSCLAPRPPASRRWTRCATCEPLTGAARLPPRRSVSCRAAGSVRPRARTAPWTASATACACLRHRGMPFENGTYDGRTVVAASWYLKAKDKGDPERANRVTVSDRSKKTYDYIALAKPTEGGNDIEPLSGVHSGGLAWVGRYLYVADTGRGLRVFDLTHIWRADTGSKAYKVANGRVSAGGYRYVLPQVGFYVPTQEGKACAKDGAPPVHSAVSVDRKTKTLVTAEYCGKKGNGLGRIVRWPLERSEE